MASIFVAAWGLLAIVTVPRYRPVQFRDRATAAAALRGGGCLAPAAAVPSLCPLPDGGLDAALGPAAGPAGLVAGSPPAGYQLRDRLAAGPGRDRLADGQVAAEARALSRQQGRTGALAAPHRAGPAMAARPARPPAAGNGRTSRPVEVSRVVQTAEGSVRPAEGAAGRDRASGEPQPPEITVAQAMAELDNMIGLSSVKDQIRQITASVEAARRRVMAGYGAEKPMQHFVFLGPPGTGKTSVARVVAKIFYAFGLLDTPVVVEAQRADLVGEYLGATAIKTNELVNSALGGVLFIDEAYSLVNDSEGQGDRFGHEAIQALLKRAEDDRTELIIILAGYEKQMEGFLASNPGLNFPVRAAGQVPHLLARRAAGPGRALPGQRGEVLDAEAGRRCGG